MTKIGFGITITIGIVRDVDVMTVALFIGRTKTHTGEVTQVCLIDVRPTLQNRKAWSLKFCCHGSYDVNADRK